MAEKVGEGRSTGKPTQIRGRVDILAMQGDPESDNVILNIR